jgi:hypothetical protein
MIDSIQDSFILTTNDRKLFLCSVEPIGPEAELHWVFVDNDRVRYIGPIWTGVLLETQVRALVNAWWHHMKMLVHPTDVAGTE